MSPARIIASLAVLASLLMGCADIDDDVATSAEETRQSLSVAGDGMGMPEMPMPPQLDVPLPGLRNDLPRPRPAVEDLRDPLGPKGNCTLTYLTLRDPFRNEPLEIPIVRCD